jgi:hypothetical protein
MDKITISKSEIDIAIDEYVDSKGEHWFSAKDYVTIKGVSKNVKHWLYYQYTGKVVPEIFALQAGCKTADCIRPDHLQFKLKKSTKVWNDDVWYALKIYLDVHSKLSEDSEKGCIEWTQSFQHHEYGKAKFNNKQEMAHRLAYKLKTKIQDLPKDLEIRHVCNVTKCINPEHLELGTHAENCKDKVAAGTSSHGEASYFSIYSEELIRQVKFAEGTVKTRSDFYKVSPSLVSALDNGVAYNWMGKTEAEDDKSIPNKVLKVKKVINVIEYTPDQIATAKRKLNEGKLTIPFAEDKSDHWIKNTRADDDGYIFIHYLGKKYRAHRLAYLLHVDMKEEGDISQSCGLRKCFNPEHLQVGRKSSKIPIQKLSEETKEAVIASKGKSIEERRKETGAGKSSIRKLDAKQGTKRKLNPPIDIETARKIKYSKGEGTTVQRAEKFGVLRSVINNIDSGKCFAYLAKDPKDDKPKGSKPEFEIIDDVEE